MTIGSTHIITPDKFVEGISSLDKKLPPVVSVVPAYKGSVHKSTVNQKALPPRTASSLPSQNSSSSKHKILGKW